LYCLLVDILKAGTLLALGPWTGEDMGRRPGKGTRYVSWDPSADLGEMFTANVVCFCEIPVDDLGIHMSKYSESVSLSAANSCFNVARTPSFIWPQMGWSLALGDSTATSTPMAFGTPSST
jgi:hypothetical protein